MKKALTYGIGSAFFFSFTFILNRSMNISGGSWIWSSSLRYIFMLPILFFIVLTKNQLIDVLKSIKNSPIKWILWSTVGFGLFYAPLSFASEYGASWLVAGTWQTTIIAGALMSPLFFKYIKTESGIVKVRNKIPKKTLIISSIILIGIFLMLFGEAEHISFLQSFLVIIPVIIAAFSYPLGNRKMMEFCSEDLNTIQRVFGMTLCSMPFWIILSIYGISSVGFPSTQQIFQTFLVAIFSGVIVTILFFKATDIVSKDAHKLAVIESTQSGEVIFTALGGIFILNDRVPGVFGVIGIVLVVFGMILNSLSRENSN
ncbi:DMT family transporter [Clostridium perfringens]|uniref:DMT family transporter n=1 Tax=Clostridium perfringens TaxID=1502 RepID=UPI002246AE06|nr:multidrug resistance efflux transporter family protein [Clostridium perfringens]MCX0410037.1 multidrug resistance efflux transporter family protein [Clostridium perfringens]